jgi:hypothetical protein
MQSFRRSGFQPGKSFYGSTFQEDKNLFEANLLYLCALNIQKQWKTKTLLMNPPFPTASRSIFSRYG